MEVFNFHYICIVGLNPVLLRIKPMWLKFIFGDSAFRLDFQGSYKPFEEFFPRIYFSIKKKAAYSVIVAFQYLVIDLVLYRIK